jgi:hypothetical protein
MRPIRDSRTGQEREADRLEIMRRNRKSHSIALRAVLGVAFLLILIAGVIVFHALGRG